MKLQMTAALAVLGAMTLTACSETDSAAALWGDPWQIEYIGDRGVIDNSPANLHFMEDGSLAGNASCNRLVGSYDATDQTMVISPTGTTMMACVPALMEQEARLLALLPTVQSYEIDAEGRLVLTTDSGQTIKSMR